MATLHGPVNWISVMGTPEVNIEATFDFDAKAVFVDAENLLAMAGGWIDSAILPDDDTIATVRAITSIPANQGGEYDVTEVGGGWDLWLSDRLGLDITGLDITADQSADVKAVLDTATRDEARAIAKAYPLESDEWHEEVERGDRITLPYYDHDGNRTSDPRCELGLCVTCLDDRLSQGGTEQRAVFTIPALSVADPSYGTDAAYRARVSAAFERLGVEYREDS